MQVPAVSSDSVLPETEQTEVVVEEKATGRLELAVADRVSCVAAYWAPVTGGKEEMVWETRCTPMLCAAVAVA